MSKIEIKKTELVWKGKYDEDGRLKPVEKPGPYPFQIVEVVNQPRIGKVKKNDQWLFELWKGNEGNTFEEGWRNKLIWGDNKMVMSSMLENFAGKIDLIYIDPPFATGADFKVDIPVGESGETVHKEHSIIEEKAYRDTWGKGFESFLHMMYERLILMKELLSEKGSIYVHLDWRANSYIRIIMDEIFGIYNFLNHVVWVYTDREMPLKQYNPKHDDILVFTKHKGDHIFNFKDILEEYSDTTKKKFKYKDDVFVKSNII